jgi:hypothetical protein
MAGNPEVFDPDTNPSFDVIHEVRPLVDSISSRTGWEQVRSLGSQMPVRATLSWDSLPKAEVDYILTFFYNLNGANGIFRYTTQTDLIDPSGIAPTALAEVSGGSLGSRTYSIKFSWHESPSFETLASAALSIAVSANFLVHIQLPAVPWPANRLRVYAHSGTPPETLQATLEPGERSWTEPATGLIAGAALPSSNNMLFPSNWILISDLQPVRITANRWRMSITIEQHKIPYTLGA